MTAYPTIATRTLLLFVIGLTAHTLAPRSAHAQQPPANDGKLRIICFGAHPDDAEYKSGGAAAMWAKQAHHVKLVSVTNGDIGHWQMAGGALAKRRTAESAKVAERLGVTCEVFDIQSDANEIKKLFPFFELCVTSADA